MLEVVGRMPNIDGGTLILGLIFSSIGLGYFIYGKNKSSLVIRCSGIALIINHTSSTTSWLY
jgi:hypothetical protein